MTPPVPIPGYWISGLKSFCLMRRLFPLSPSAWREKYAAIAVNPHPKAAEYIDKYQLDALAKRFDIPEVKLLKGKGCEACSHTGYKGRMAVIEYLGCDDAIKAMPKDSDFIPKAKQHNSDINRRNLLEDGLYKAILGLTTVEEVLRIAG